MSAGVALEAVRTDERAAEPTEVAEPGMLSVGRAMLGGHVGVHLGLDGAVADSRARHDAESLLTRIEAWARRLTRFSPDSDLMTLNASSLARVPVGPTLATVLDWGRVAQGLSGGIVDIAMLDARLAAEWSDPPDDDASAASPASRQWSIQRGPRRSNVVRPSGLTFDLDGVAKGWLADRASRRLAFYPSAIVDADGDVAIRIDGDRQLTFGVADPREPGARLTTLVLDGPGAGRTRRFGLATSGTSIHRWQHGSCVTHHLIDPRTGRSARTDVVQATVLGTSAREAEAIAKTVVILGSEVALDRLAWPDVQAAILLTETGEVLMTPGTSAWLR